MSAAAARESITICEVGLRDGIQNEKVTLATAHKLELVGALVSAGLRCLEIASFVSPKAMPHMADAPEVMAEALRRWPHAYLSALVITEVGYERAVRAGARALAVVVIASESLSRRNNRMSVEESLRVCSQILSRARRDGVRMRVYLSAAWGCPYEGPVEPTKVISLAERIWDLGPDELALADSVGRAGPEETRHVLEQAGRRFGTSRLAVHLHNTGGQGLENAAAALAAGVRTLDASIGGLGGCPFAEGTSGNLATEDLVALAHGLGFETGVRPEKLRPIAERLGELLGRPLGGSLQCPKSVVGPGSPPHP